MSCIISFYWNIIRHKLNNDILLKMLILVDKNWIVKQQKTIGKQIKTFSHEILNEHLCWRIMNPCGEFGFDEHECYSWTLNEFIGIIRVYRNKSDILGVETTPNEIPQIQLKVSVQFTNYMRKNPTFIKREDPYHLIYSRMGKPKHVTLFCHRCCSRNGFN